MGKHAGRYQKHMTLDDRIYIQNALELHRSFSDIAKFLSKHPTSISKEIMKHRYLKQAHLYEGENRCKKRLQCKRFKDVCGHAEGCRKQCKTCSQCNSVCPDFVYDLCEKLKKAPYVCNGCEKKRTCRSEKYYYSAGKAFSEYRETIVSSREGVNISEERVADLNALLTPLLRKGQSIAHIYSSHSDEIEVTPKTLYNYIGRGILAVRNIDLHRKVKYKPRQKHVSGTEKDRKWLDGRRYSDFLNFIEEYPEKQIVEMDTVIGRVGGKALLTLFFRSSKCMLVFLLQDKIQECVLEVLHQLESSVGTDIFKRTFPVILTDNGSEFLNPITLEASCNTGKRSRVYYCDPYSAFQKAMLEKNHEYIRYILPKGTSFDSLVQKDVTLISNHINNTARNSMNGQTPFELASLLMDKNVIEAAGLEKIERDCICLSPNLLRN